MKDSLESQAEKSEVYIMGSFSKEDAERLFSLYMEGIQRKKMKLEKEILH